MHIRYIRPIRPIVLFPFLIEGEEYETSDLFTAAEKLNEEKSSKYLQAVLENKEVINENYKIMQLYNPSLSYQRRKIVDNCLSEREKLFNLTGYKLMLSQDGFMSLRWDTLIQTMRRIVDE